MRSFGHVTPALRVFAGPDSLKSLGRELERLQSQRAAIFCPRSLAQSASEIAHAIGPRCAGVFDGVRAHSPVPDVRLAVATLKEWSADSIVIVGGGSAGVTARAASILLAEGDDVRKLATRRDAKGQLVSPKLDAAKLPNIVIPTTPNTGIAKAGSAVLDPSDGSRLALFDPKTRTSAVFVHPGLVKTAPRTLFVSAALDTLAQSIEGLTTKQGDPISDALLIHSTRLLVQYLAADDAREDAVLAAMMTGQGTDHSGASIASVVGHSLVGHANADNGITKLIALPHALRFNLEAGAAGFPKLAAAFDLSATGSDLAARVLGAIEELAAKLGLPRRLRDVGVKKEDLPKVAEKGMSDWFLRGSPRPVRDVSELTSLLEEAW